MVEKKKGQDQFIRGGFKDTSSRVSLSVQAICIKPLARGRFPRSKLGKHLSQRNAACKRHELSWDIGLRVYRYTENCILIDSRRPSIVAELSRNEVHSSSPARFDLKILPKE